MLRKIGFVVLLAAIATTVGCNKASNTASSTDSSSSSSSSSANVSAKSTSALAAEASEEVSSDDSCQSEEPDFDAIKEKLIEKLTALLTKLQAIDTTNFSDKQLTSLNTLIEKVTADLATVNAATELSDELKEIARKVWNPLHGKDHHHFGPPPNSTCQNAVKDEMKTQHCADLAKVLAIDGLSDTFKNMLQARYDELCTD